MELAQRVAAALSAAHHPEAEQPGGTQREGFLVQACDDGGATVHWICDATADPVTVSARRFFLARYADTLSQAGIRAVLVEGPGEPYLHCPPR